MGYDKDHEFHLSSAAKAVASLVELRQQRPIGATCREPVTSASIDEALCLIRSVLVEHNDRLRSEAKRKQLKLRLVEQIGSEAGAA